MLNLTRETPNRCSILPQLWFNMLFKVPTQYFNENQHYFYNFFKNKLNILDCKLNVPRKINWKGHPFYFEIFKSFGKTILELPQSIENILSIPIWFNKHLKTKFDVDISRVGINFVKDLYPDGQLLEFNLNRPELLPSKLRKIQKMIDNIPEVWRDCIESSAIKCTVVSPRQVVNFDENDYFVQHLGTDRMYKILIYKIIKVPAGVLRWRTELVLSDKQLQTSLTFAKLCSSSVFDQVFQYKIVTQILPTNKYLHRYQIADSEICSRCSECVDTVYHNIWQCRCITLYLSTCFNFLRYECNLVDIITVENYIFGFMDLKREGINHILLELKKHVFYNWKAELGVIAFCEQFQSKLRSLIIKEKIIAQSYDRILAFNEKWEKYTAIYDFRGPDMQINS